MKKIVKGNKMKRSAMNESLDYGEEDEPMGRVGGKYDFIMMVGDGTVYGFEGREIYFTPIGDLRDPIGFQWEPVKGKEVDFNWLPLDDGEEHWVSFEDMIDDYDDEVEYNDDGFDYREWM